MNPRWPLLRPCVANENPGRTTVGTYGSTAILLRGDVNLLLGDGTYEANCDASRAYTNITQILQAAAPSTLQDMQTYWKDYTGNDESFWEHEWGKHGTCISTLEPSCYPNYKPTQEAVDYFNRAVSLFQTLPSYSWLAAAGIVPSTTQTYTLSAIQSALTSHFGFAVTINCNSKKELDELWYHYNVQGSVQSGTFQPAAPVGSGSTCPSTGIKYLPKPGGTATTTGTPGTTPGTTVTTSTAASTATGAALSGKGYLNVVSGGSQNGCIISAGTWYTTGTCATFTATPSGMFSVSLLTSFKYLTNGSRFRLHTLVQQGQVRHLEQRADMLVVCDHGDRLCV